MRHEKTKHQSLRQTQRRFIVVARAVSTRRHNATRLSRLSRLSRQPTGTPAHRHSLSFLRSSTPRWGIGPSLSVACQTVSGTQPGTVSSAPMSHGSTPPKGGKGAAAGPAILSPRDARRGAGGRRRAWSLVRGGGGGAGGGGGGGGLLG